MAIITMEGFEGYSNTTEFENLTSWNLGRPDSQSSFQTGRMGGKCLHYTGSTSMFTNDYFYFSTYNPTVIVGFAFRMGNIEPCTLCNLDTWSNSNFLAKVINGNLNFYYSYSVTDYLQGSYGPIYPDTWYYLEMKVKHGNDGIFVAKINEQTVVDTTGDFEGFQETIGFHYVNWYFSQLTNLDLDDFYLLDDTGSTFNDFLGDIRIDTIHPSEAGNYSQFTPSAGNNYECVDETQHDDSDYVESANVGDKDTYGYDDVPTELDDSGIYALRMVSFPKRTVPADNVKLKHLVRQGGSDYTQTEQSLPETFYMLEDYVEKDPSDNGDWTKARINSAEFGVEVG